MPELPEVERVRLGLEPVLAGARVVRATLHRRDVLALPGDPAGGFSRQRQAVRPRRVARADLLEGERLTGVRRRGKQLAIVAEGGRSIVVHLGMTGHLRVLPAGARLDRPDHIHATWRLIAPDGSAWRLVFRDPRRFGGLWALPTALDLHTRWAELGPDALAISPSALGQALAGARRPLKAALLDQARIAGLGNIYADEACFHARLDPHRVAAALTPPEIHRLADSIRAILAQALAAGGSTLRDYADARGHAGTAQHAHAVYGRGGQPCPSCGRALASDRLAQRATVWCPRCQH